MRASATPMHPHGILSTPTRIGPIQLRNRLSVAPMTRVSATAEGVPTTRMRDYYEGFARGGFGLVITEGIYTDRAFSQGYLYQPGLTDDAQQAAWHGIVDRVHAHGARIFAQLMHAGALSQGNRFRDRGAGPSAIEPRGEQMSFYRGQGRYPVPLEMGQAEIDEAVDGFAQAAARAFAAGFDGVEIHGANGYLIDQFLTRYSNHRQDGYGGDTGNRIRLLQQVAVAVRQRVGDGKVVGVRVSQGKVNDFLHKWEEGLEDARTIFQRIGRLPVDYVHTTEFEAWQPAFGAGASLASLAREHARLPVIANGSLHHPERATAMVAADEASLVSLGRGALANADWPRRVDAGLAVSEFNRTLLSPVADLENAERVCAEG